MPDDDGEDFLALPSRRLFAGTDPRQLHKAISEVTANTHRMLLTEPNSRLSGVVHGLKLGRLGLVSIRYSQPLAVTSRATRRRVLVVIPRAPMQVFSGEKSWFSDAPFVMGTHHSTRVIPAPGRGALLVALDAEHLEHSIEAATGTRFGEPLRLTSERRPLLLAASDLVRSAAREVCRGIELADDDVQPDLLAQHLFSAISIGVSPFLHETLDRMTSPGRGYVEAATRFITEHLAEDLSVSRIARCCGISERQLHTAFKDHLSIAPGQFVREKRLQGVRRLLTDPEFAATGTVSAAAAHVGVAHFGRFAKAYAERYDEPPSHTLAETRAKS